MQTLLEALSCCKEGPWACATSANFNRPHLQPSRLRLRTPQLRRQVGAPLAQRLHVAAQLVSVGLGLQLCQPSSLQLP